MIGPISPGSGSGSADPALEGRVNELEVAQANNTARLNSLENIDEIVQGDLQAVETRVAIAEADIETLQGNVEEIGLLSPVDITYTVPGDYPTITAALAAARLRKTRPGKRVFIKIADGTYDEYLSFISEDLSYVKLSPAVAPVEHVTSTGAITVAGATRAWSVTIPVAEAAQYSVGGYVWLWVPNAGATAAALDTDARAAVCGFWPITAVTANSITVANTSSAALSAVSIPTLRICRARVKIRGQKVIFGDGAKLPEFEDIGIIDTSGVYDPGVSAGVEIINRSELKVYQEPRPGAAARYRFGIHGHTIGLMARDSSLVVGPIAVSGTKEVGFCIVSNSRSSGRGLIATGCGIQNSGPGAYVEDTGNISASDVPGVDLVSVLAGNRGTGLSNVAASATIMLAALRGNPNGDSYATGSSRSRHANSPAGQIGATSPTLNTLGNNNAYIWRSGF